MIVEVLSDTTERIDRREKLLAYSGIPSLQEYLLVRQDRLEVEIHRRQDQWRSIEVSNGEVKIQCLNIPVPVAVIYEDVLLD